MKKKFGIYILIISVVLLGLLWLQYFWIDYSIKLKNSELDKQVNEVLFEVGEEIEKNYFCFKLYADVDLDKDEGFYMLKHQGDENGELRQLGLGNDADIIDTLNAYYKIEGTDSVGKVNRFKFSAPINAKVELNFEFDYARTLEIEDTAGGFKDWVIDSYENTLIDDSSSFRIVDTLFLKKLFREKLTALGLDTNYQYGLAKGDSKSLIYCSTGNCHEELAESALNVTFYDKVNFYNPYTLYLFIPDWNNTLLKNLWLMVLSSIAILVVLIWMFVFFLRVIMDQRKLNEMKSDFIHNMTHEFNTPVSNINLALDTIEKQYNGSTDQLWKIIREENKRIQGNIALILQTSAMEKNKLNMVREMTDLKEVVSKVVASFQFKVEKQHGKLTASCLLDNANVPVDEIHLANLLHNLIDNAIKYSGNTIDIELVLKKITGGIAIMVKDNGIGIREDDQDKIFDKFFRVSTGNVHDVKGFGLGLHYVRQVIEAHNGKIQVKSKLGKGSTFIIHLPE